MTDCLARLEELTKTVAGMRSIVNAQVKQLHMHAFSIKNLLNIQGGGLKGDVTVYSVIGPMVHMAAISGLSLLKLTEDINLNVKDAFPVARSVVESIVNVCYLMAEEKEAERALRHAEFRSLRDLRRSWQTGPISMSVAWQGEISAASKARLGELSKEFISRKGRELSWTDRTLRQRLDAAFLKFDQKSLMSLSGSAFNIYGAASEVVHGSYFSAIHFLGLTGHRRSETDNMLSLKITLLEHQFSVLMSAILAYTSFVECFSAYSDQPALLCEADEAFNKLRDLRSET